LNIRDLHYFIAVVELRHFGRAARQCHVSQPTLSGQIKKLEETLSLQLFERDKRNVYLTHAGQKIATIAKRLLKEEAEIYELAQSLNQPFSGQLKIGAFPTLAAYYFPTVVDKIRTRFKSLKLILVEEKTHTLIEQLKDAQIDAALLALPVDEPSLACAPLFEDPFYLAVPNAHTLSKLGSVNPSMVARLELLLLSEGHCLRDQALEFCALNGGTENQDFRATSLETLRQMVKAGTGCTLMPEIALGTSEDSVVYIPFEPHGPSRSIGLFWRHSFGNSNLMDALVSALRSSR